MRSADNWLWQTRFEPIERASVDKRAALVRHLCLLFQARAPFGTGNESAEQSESMSTWSSDKWCADPDLSWLHTATRRDACRHSSGRFKFATLNLCYERIAESRHD